MESTRWFVLVAGAAALLPTGCKDKPVDAPTCTAATDCDAVAASKGYLCIDSACVACTGDSECHKVAYYGESSSCTDGRCVAASACTPGIFGCSCQQGSRCDTGLVCDSGTSLCRAAITCAQLECAAHQLCGEPTGGQDAQCLPECATGYEWSDTTSLCTEVVTTCDAGSTLALQCDQQHKDCVADASGARCGDCLSNYRSVGDACVATCDLPSLKGECDSEHKECAESDEGAHCAGCIAGYILDGDTCRPAETCASLGCALPARCIEAQGQDAKCVPDGADICQYIADVFKGTGPCPTGQAWHPGTKTQMGSCVPCKTCPNKPAYTGQIYPVTDRDGTCICVPNDGYFFTGGNSRLNQNCDADGDGWVRADARDGVNGDDCAIKANTKCDVRTIDTFVLITDEGSEPAGDWDGDDGPGGEWETGRLDIHVTEDVALQNALNNGVLDLYERAADDNVDVRGTQFPDLVAYNTTGFDQPAARAPNLNELNSLTKGCMDGPGNAQSVDYNANGIPDIEEWHGMPKPQSDIPDWQAAFLHYSYYMELYEGHYVAKDSPKGAGEYWIVEKTRHRPLPSDPPERITNEPMPLECGASYRTCYRRVDPGLDPEPGETTPSIGMDFQRWSAQVDPDIAHGPSMTHSSEFKCVHIDGGDPPTSTRRAEPHVVYQTELDSLALDFNGCFINDDAGATPIGAIDDGKAGFSPVFSCQQIDPAVGTTTFAVVEYQDYDSEDVTFQGGCINACAEQDLLPLEKRCEGWDSSSGACRNDAATGERQGCYYNAGCAHCQWDSTQGQWNCAPGDCGNCATCTSTGTLPLEPVYTCISNRLACTGDCSLCAYADGKYDCVAQPTECDGCAECQQAGDTAFECTGIDSRCDHIDNEWDCVRSEPNACTYSGGVSTRTNRADYCDVTEGHGTCIENYITETSGPCSLDTDGLQCADTTVVESGTCVYQSTCAQVGEKMVTKATWKCENQSCNKHTVYEEQICRRNTDGKCATDGCPGDSSLACCQSGSCASCSVCVSTE